MIKVFFVRRRALHACPLLTAAPAQILAAVCGRMRSKLEARLENAERRAEEETAIFGVPWHVQGQVTTICFPVATSINDDNYQQLKDMVVEVISFAECSWNSVVFYYNMKTERIGSSAATTWLERVRLENSAAN